MRHIVLPRTQSYFSNRLLVLVVFLLTLTNPTNSTAAKPQSIGGDFTLTAHDGSRFELERLRGRIVLIYFGFTSCPDVCPMELSNIGKALNAIPNKLATGLFITVDPLRDSVKKLAAYVRFFHPDIIGLTGTEEEIRKVAERYNVTYKRVDQGTSYTMDHSSHIFVLDELGELRALAPFGSTSEHIVQLILGITVNATD